MKVNGFISQNFEDGSYVIVALAFDSNDPRSDYRKLTCFAIINFKQRTTETLDADGNHLIRIDKPWVEYYLENYKNSTYVMTPPTDDQINEYYLEKFGKSFEKELNGVSQELSEAE